MVTEVYRNVGDAVKFGDVLYAFRQRELAELKSSYLASMKRVELALERHLNGKSGFGKRLISSEKTILLAVRLGRNRR